MFGLFSYGGAVKEMKRNNENGGNTYISKRWYGWIVIDPDHIGAGSGG